jgi:hypothetical protein
MLSSRTMSERRRETLEARTRMYMDIYSKTIAAGAPIDAKVDAIIVAQHDNHGTERSASPSSSSAVSIATTAATFPSGTNTVQQLIEGIASNNVLPHQHENTLNPLLIESRTVSDLFFYPLMSYC